MITTTPDLTDTTVRTYLKELSPERRSVLEKMRAMVLGIWPDAVEDMAMKTPTYHVDGHPLLAIADRKNYIALNIVPHDLLHVFKTELRQYDHGRSCIRFKRLDPTLTALLERIIRYTGSQLSTSRYYRKGSQQGQ